MNKNGTFEKSIQSKRDFFRTVIENRNKSKEYEYYLNQTTGKRQREYLQDKINELEYIQRIKYAFIQELEVR